MKKTKKQEIETEITYSILDIVFQNFFVFICFTLAVGYNLGVIVLFKLARPLATLATEQSWPFQREDMLIKIIILFLIGISILFGAAITRLWVKIRFGKIILIGGIILISLLTINKLPSPESFWDKGLVFSSAKFTFGPYPSDEIISQLRLRKYTTVVSLLNPLVVPIEPKLLKEERKKLKNSGINLIEAPLLPWINTNQNNKSLALLRQLAQHGQGKYYIHCYLGRDRIRMAMAEIEPYSKDIRVITPGFKKEAK